jgi:hypothetical protein
VKKKRKKRKEKISNVSFDTCLFEVFFSCYSFLFFVIRFNRGFVRKIKGLAVVGLMVVMEFRWKKRENFF